MKLNFDLDAISTPAYVIDENLLRANLKILQRVQNESGCKILLAQKAFSCYSFYPIIGQYISGTVASGLYEARLGYEEMGKDNHIYSPAYYENEFLEITKYCSHIVFNSFKQWNKFKDPTLQANISAGLRINPELSTQTNALYDPCAYGSRMGVTIANFDENSFQNIEGLHMHCLCEQDFEPLLLTFKEAERKFGKYFDQLKWINLGGGHHITKEGYDIDGLINLIKTIRAKYGLEVFLEPGEAVVLNCGFLVGTVREIVHNNIDIAILDVSSACHMPDVLEMPYRPPVMNGSKAGEKPYTYRLSSATCLAGDVVGDYSFDYPLSEGSKVVFEDMALYTMVKNNTFNGMPLPSIYKATSNGQIELIKKFGYQDFKSRL